jgi:KTSC domain
MSIISERIEGKIISVDIKSSNISRATYDTESKVLVVTFNNGSIYEYLDVPWELFTKFRMSDSQGSFLNSKVKNKHIHKKLN